MPLGLGIWLFLDIFFLEFEMDDVFFFDRMVWPLDYYTYLDYGFEL